VTLAARAAAKFAEQRGADPTTPWGDTTPPTNGMLGSPVAGVTVSEKTALGVAAVYSCLRVASDAVATTPFDVYTGIGDAKSTVRKPPVLVQPDVEMLAITWWVMAVVSLLLRGNVFGQIIARDTNLYPTQIKLIHPDQVVVRRTSDGTPEFRYHGTVVDLDDVFHIPYIAVPGAITGINPIQYLRYTFGLAHAADLYGGAFFQNSANPSLAIEYPNDLEPEEALALARTFEQQHQGIGQAHLPAVVTEGAKIVPISISPKDSQFLESRQFSRAEIATIFGIPPHMIGDVDRTTSWGMGIEQQERMFNNTTLSGILTRFQQAFSANSVTPKGQRVEFDLSQRYMNDVLTESQADVLARNGGWLNVDEIRARRGLAPLPNGAGKDYLMPLNMGILGDDHPAMQPKNQPAPPTAGGEPQPPTGLDDPDSKNP
jgi:HK97 family phage portal protein